MITLKDFLECIDYRITEGSDYMWNCYGDNTYQLDSWNGKYRGSGGHTINVVFDKTTQVVYEMQAWDEDLDRAYRWIHPDYLSAVKAEYEQRDIDFKEACDRTQFTDIEVAQDMLDKAHAIARGEEYDHRVQLELTLSDDEVFTMMKLAHERDITFNQLVEQILIAAIDNAEL